MSARFYNKKVSPQKNKLYLASFLILWLIVNILQSIFTELANDEAYYWLYSRSLDWGYFDHPPMVALIVKIGTFLFSGELGVRIIPILFGLGTLWILYNLAFEEDKNPILFFMLVSSMVLVHSHIGGFLAIPDQPVVFFSALFFLFYKKYLKDDSIILSVLLGLVAAAMLYSKYHGVLVLFFTLVSNWKILKRRSFWIIPLVVIVAMLPHLFWQINNNYATFQYHLVSRASWYSILHTLDYIGGQLLIAGPFIAPILFYHAIKRKAIDSFEKALKLNFYGFFLLFFLSSFRGHVEPHWTAIALIPLIILSYKNIKSDGLASRWIRVLFIPTILIFIFLRLTFVFEILPRSIHITREFHNWDKSAKEIKEIAGDRKVVFVNSFQRPSKYSFYTGDLSYSLNSVYYRRNQFDLWAMSDSLLGADVLVMSSRFPDSTITTANSDKYRYKKHDNFKFYYGLNVTPESYDLNGTVGDTVYTAVTFFNPRSDTLSFESSFEKSSVKIAMAYRPYGAEWLRERPLLDITSSKIPPGESRTYQIKFLAPDNPAVYWIYFGITNDYLYPQCNLNPVVLTIH